MRRRDATAELRDELGIPEEPHPLVAHFAKVNGISLDEAYRHVDATFEACASKGAQPSLHAVMEALGQVAAVHHAGAELRELQQQPAAKKHRPKWGYPKRRW